MPLKNGHLTPRERSFAAAYASTGDVAYSASKAGFSAMSGGANALARPAVREMVEQMFRTEMQGKILPLAMRRHRQILEDQASCGPTLTKAIELGYKYGLAPPEDISDKEIFEMSAAELQARIIRLEAVERALEEEAKQIEGFAIEERGQLLELEPSIFD